MYIVVAEGSWPKPFYLLERFSVYYKIEGYWNLAKSWKNYSSEEKFL